MAKMIWWDDDIIQYEWMCSVRDVNAPQILSSMVVQGYIKEF